VSKEIDHDFTDQIVCPYCGEEVSDSWELDGECGEFDCESCGNTYKWERVVTIEYSTRKKKNRRIILWD